MKKLITILLLLPVLLHAQTIGRQRVDSFPIYDWSVYPSSGLQYGLTWLPISYSTSPAKKYPLIINLEGTGQTGTGKTQLSNLNTDGLGLNIANGWNPTAVNPVDGQTYEFIVVTPMNSGWADTYDQLKYVLPNVLKKYRVDSSRVYIHGLSAGGDAALTAITANPSFTQLFAAAAIASGAAMDGISADANATAMTAQQTEANLKLATATYGVGAWLCFGDQDQRENLRYEDSLNKNGPKVPAKMTELAGVGHSAWKQMENPQFRPVGNYYGKIAESFKSQANTNGSGVAGTGKTQDSLNLFEWFLTFQKKGNSLSSGGTTGPASGSTTARKAQRYKIIPGVLPNIAPGSDVGINIPAGSLIPGDTVDISNAYAWTYGQVKANGTADSPIVIINSGGQVTFTGGFTIIGQHIKMIGSGVPGISFGFYLTNPTPNLRSQGPFAVTITDSSAYVDVSWVSIYHTGIGFNVKNENDCSPGLQYPAWVINHIHLHHNRIIGTWNEGMYLGTTSPDNGKNSYDSRPVVCNGITTYPMPFRVGNILVDSNYIDSTGRGGIQLASTDTSMNEIAFNEIHHAGMNGDDQQGTAISVGSYVRARIHDNYGSDTYTWSFAALGFDSLIVENNHFDSAGFLVHYNRANTADQTFNPSKEPTSADSLPWIESGFFKTVSTLTGDSSVAKVQNNYWGICKNMAQQLDLLDNYGTFKKNGATYFCNNSGAGGAAQIYKETPAISYTTCQTGIVTPPPVTKTILFSIQLNDGKTFTLYVDGSYSLQ